MPHSRTFDGHLVHDGSVDYYQYETDRSRLQSFGQLSHSQHHYYPSYNKHHISSIRNNNYSNNNNNNNHKNGNSIHYGRRSDALIRDNGNDNFRVNFHTQSQAAVCMSSQMFVQTPKNTINYNNNNNNNNRTRSSYYQANSRLNTRNNAFYPDAAKIQSQLAVQTATRMPQQKQQTRTFLSNNNNNSNKNGNNASLATRDACAVVSSDSSTKHDNNNNSKRQRVGPYDKHASLAKTLQGRVFKGKDKTGQRVIIKQAYKKLVDSKKCRPEYGNKPVAEDIENEIILLAKLSNNYNNPYRTRCGFSRYIDEWEDDYSYYLITEYGGKSMAKFVDEQRIRSKSMAELLKWQQNVREYFAQLVQTVHYFHLVGNVAHFDLSLENTVIDEECKQYLSIIDFGLAKEFESDQKWVYFDAVGKSEYQAPEICNLNKFKGFDPRLQDTWCLGIMLFAMCFGGRPWVVARKHKDSNFAAFCEQNRKWHDILGPNGWKLGHLAEKPAIDVLEGVLKVDPKERWNIEELMKNPYVYNAPKSGWLVNFKINSNNNNSNDDNNKSEQDKNNCNIKQAYQQYTAKLKNSNNGE